MRPRVNNKPKEQPWWEHDQVKDPEEISDAINHLNTASTIDALGSRLGMDPLLSSFGEKTLSKGVSENSLARMANEPITGLPRFVIPRKWESSLGSGSRCAWTE